MKVYAIASTVHQVMGQGDNFSQDVIKRLGAYGEDGWPPIFRTKSSAEEYRNGLKYGSYRVIELELEDE